ncbi:MAG: hypothetical protein KF830_05500 [Planctomycetes bacterium]|nr:hypothetical protein [Planctomycetota bacterium]
MASREPELDHLTRLLGQCLGRIEEQAFRLQDDSWQADEHGTFAAMEDETATLHDLVDSLLVCAIDEHADLNAIVARALLDQLGTAGVPLVVRQRLDRHLPKVAGAPADVAFAVRRALAIGFGRPEPGTELVLTTRREDGHLLFELERRGGPIDDHLAERCETLAEFTAGLNGHCRVHAEACGSLLLALELPAALAFDER